MLGRTFLLSELATKREANKNKIVKGFNDAKARVVKAKETVEDDFWNAHIGTHGQVLIHYDGDHEDDADVHALTDWKGEFLGRAVSTSDGLVTAEHCITDEPVQEISIDGVPVVSVVQQRSSLWDIAILSKYRKGYETAPFTPKLPITVVVLGVIHSIVAEIVPDSNFICFSNQQTRMGPGFSGTPVFQAGKVVAIFVGTQTHNPIAFASVIKKTSTRPQNLPRDVVLCMPRPKVVKAETGIKAESETRHNRDFYARYGEPSDDDGASDNSREYDDDFSVYDERSVSSGYSHDTYAPNSKKRREKAVKAPETVVFMTNQTPPIPQVQAPSTNPFDNAVLVDEVLQELLSYNPFDALLGEEGKVAEETVSLPCAPNSHAADPVEQKKVTFKSEPDVTLFKRASPEAATVRRDDSDEESDDEVPPPPPPPPAKQKPSVWKEATADNGVKYWYNTLTREVQWDPPTTVVSPPPTLMTQKEFAALKYQEELEALRNDIKEINAQGTYLSGVIDLSADEKVAYPPNVWEKMTLIKQLRLLKAKHGALKQRNAVAEKQRKEIVRAQTTISKYHAEIAKLEAKISDSKEKPDF